ELDDDGGLIALGGKSILKLDDDSRIIWKLDIPAHHHFNLLESGQIFTLMRRYITLPYTLGVGKVCVDYVAIISPTGKVIKEVSLHDLFNEDISWWQWLKIYRTSIEYYLLGVERLENSPLDIYHANSIKILDRDIPGFGNKGDALVSFLKLNTVAVIDLDEEEVRWKWGEDVLSLVHSPRLLDDNSILLFENGWKRNYSRVLIYSPADDEIIWEFLGDPPYSFDSNYRGQTEPLPNGNILVTVSDQGWAFEVTRDKEVVWKYHNPTFKDGSRAILGKMGRYPVGIVSKIGQNST
ncbi:arylsulfotransferase family protein, partial [Candidatus Altiarchaeota archaeon]